MTSSTTSSIMSNASHKKLKRKHREQQNKVNISDSESSNAESDSSGSDRDDEEEDVGGRENEIKTALSHAEQRRQRKKMKTDRRESKTDCSSKKRKLKDGSGISCSAKAKRQNSVWIGNMSFKTQLENLRSFLDGCGEITRINMPTKSPAGPSLKPENRGFAYVDFATPEGKATAIDRSENPLLGRRLLIKDGDSFEGRPDPVAGIGSIDMSTSNKLTRTAQKILRSQKQPPAATLFIGNLGFEVKEADIRGLFEAHRVKAQKPKSKGEEGGDENEEAESKSKVPWIRKVRMGTFEDSGLCKGFAFIDFVTIEQAISALINPRNHHLNGRDLVVQFAGADAVRRGAPKIKSNERDGVGNGGYKGRDTKPQAEGSRPLRNILRHTNETRDNALDTVHDGDSKANIKSDKGIGHEGLIRHKGPRSRPKPGAALALAKRESAAIVQSQGRKIVF